MNRNLEYVSYGLRILEERKPGKRGFMQKLLRRFKAGVATLEDDPGAQPRIRR